MLPVPPSLQRLVDQIDGWLDLRCPERALDLLPRVLEHPEGRAIGLELRVRANARLGDFAAALQDLADLRPLHPDEDWVDLTDAWVRRRADDLPGAIDCLRGLLQRNHRHDLAHFNLACYLAISGDGDAAIDSLSLACGLNPQCRDFARDDPDLDALRRDDRFRELLR